MHETLRLFDVPAAQPRRSRPGVLYVCPGCWQRVELALPLEEPPLCEPCGCRMRLLQDPAPAAGKTPPPAAQTGDALLP